jgi:hypothetical protein
MDWTAIPTGVGGLGLVVVSVIALVRYLLSDKSVATTHATQIQALEKRCDGLERSVHELEQENREQRSAKHEALNRLAIASGTLSIVGRLYDKCTCGALDVIADLIPPEVPR